MAGDPGTFLAQRFLGDLDDDFLARLEQLADLLRTARNRLRPAPVGPEAPPARLTVPGGPLQPQTARPLHTGDGSFRRRPFRRSFSFERARFLAAVADVVSLPHLGEGFFQSRFF